MEDRSEEDTEDRLLSIIGSTVIGLAILPMVLDALKELPEEELRKYRTSTFRGEPCVDSFSLRTWE